MKILVVDVGVGTQDIMLYDTNDAIENSVKMVLPSPTRIFAERIRKYRNDLFINGQTMGGGPINNAIKNHLEKGYRVVMTQSAAKTVRDDLDRVRSLGIEIVPDGEKHPDIGKIELKDVDLEAIREALSKFDVELDFDHIGIAVQDHGFMEGVGDRNFRFHENKRKIRGSKKPRRICLLQRGP